MHYQASFLSDGAKVDYSYPFGLLEGTKRCGGKYKDQSKEVVLVVEA